MATLRKEPIIYVSWLRNYLIGDHLCRWSIWHRIYHEYEKAKENFDSVKYKMEHTALAESTRKRLIKAGYEVVPEMSVKVYGQIAKMIGKIDLVALREDGNYIVEVKTGKPREADRIQLMLYIWALPKTYSRFRGASFDGVLVYPDHEIQISALTVDEDFVKNFKQFTTDILSSEPDRKYPHPDECRWCKIGNCDERLEFDDEEKSEFKADFF